MNDQAYSFFQFMADAKEAMEKNPQLEERHAQREEELQQATATIAGFKARVVDLQSTIEELTAKVRSLEVERDEAGFRELEVKESLEALLRTFRVVSGTVGEAIEKYSPKPAEPSMATLEQMGKTDETAPEAQPTTEPVSAEDTTTESAVSDGSVTYKDDSPELSVKQISDDIDNATTTELPTEPIQHQLTEYIPSQPYTNIQPQDKPHDVSWKDFVSGGGRRPFWVTDEMMNYDPSLPEHIF